MKNLMKKMLSLILTLTMVLPMTVFSFGADAPVMAAETATIVTTEAELRAAVDAKAPLIHVTASMNITGPIFTQSTTKIVGVGTGITLTAANATCMFCVNPYSIALENLNFANGFAGTQASYSLPGGALAVYGSSADTAIVVTDCTFTNCKNNFGVGGAIYCESGSLSITGCTFSGCAATYGGAFQKQGAGTIAVTDTTFTDCVATNVAGAFWVNADNATLLTDCVFTRCTAGSDGNADAGAIYMTAGSLKTVGCTFSDCHLNTTQLHNGGAVSTGTALEFEFVDTTFENCRATCHGGAVHNECGNTILRNCTLSGNSCAGFGGAVYTNTGSILSTDGTKCIGNHVDTFGGALYSQTGNITVKNTTFTNNTAASKGANVYLGSGDLVIKETEMAAGTYYTAAGARVIQYPEATEQPVFSVKDFGARGDGVSLDSPYVQLGLDYLKELGGGTLQFPAGTYLCASMRVYSNTTVEFCAGSVIRISGNESDYGHLRGEYDEVYERSAEALVGKSEASLDATEFMYLQGRRGYTDCIFFANETENVTFTGEGKIDGHWEDFFVTDPNDPLYYSVSEVSAKRWCQRIDGGMIYRPHGWRPQIFNLMFSNNLELSDFSIEGAPFFNVHIVVGTGIRVNNITVTSNIHCANTDGINVHAVADCSITNCDVQSGDDCYAISGSCNGVMLDHCTAQGSTTLARLFVGIDEYLNQMQGIGTPGALEDARAQVLQNVTIQNCTQKNGGAFMMAYATYGTVHGIHLYNNSYYSTSGDAAIFLCIQEDGNMSDVLVDGFESEGTGAVTIMGNSAYQMRNIAIKNANFKVNPRTKMFGNGVPDPVIQYWLAPWVAYNIYVRHASQISFQNVKLTWGTSDLSDLAEVGNASLRPDWADAQWRDDMNPTTAIPVMTLYDVDGLVLDDFSGTGFMGAQAIKSDATVRNVYSDPYTVNADGFAECGTYAELYSAVACREEKILLTNDITLAKGLELGADTLIKAQTTKTLTGNDTFVLIQANDFDITLENVNLTHGYGGTSASTYDKTILPGGAISSITGDVTVRGGQITDCGCQASAGAIFSHLGTVSITGTTFSNDKAAQAAGAILVNNGILNLTDCRFIGCGQSVLNQLNNAGAVHLNGPVTAVIRNCEFTNNNTTCHGGAIYAGPGSVLTVENSVFTGNHCAGFGAAIYGVNSEFTLIDVTQSNNKTDTSGGMIIRNDGGTVEARVSTENALRTATSQAIERITVTAPITLTSALFLSTNTTFYGEGEGAGFYGDGTFVLLCPLNQVCSYYDLTFSGGRGGTGSTKVGDTTMIGAAITSMSGNQTIVNCTFKNNQTTGNGIVWTNTGKIDVNNCRFEDNTVSARGMVFGNQSSSRLSVQNTAFVHNQSKYAGTCIYTTEGRITEKNNWYSENKATTGAQGDVGAGSGKITDTTDIVLAGQSLELAGKIGTDFYFEIKDSALVSNQTPLVARATIPNSGETIIADYPVDASHLQTVNSKIYYRFTPYVTSVEMNQDITVQFYYGEKIASAAYTYKVSDYAKTIVDNAASYPATLVDLCKAMLNYGSYAQLQFGYHTDDLPNGILTPAERDVSDVTSATLAAYEATVEQTPGFGGVNFAGSMLALETGAVIKNLLRVTVPNGTANVEEAAAAIMQQYTVKRGKMTMTPVLYMTNGSNVYFRVTYPATASNKLGVDDPLLITKNGETMTIHVNALSYAQLALNADDQTAPTNLKNVCRALYKYYDAAVKFFG